MSSNYLFFLISFLYITSVAVFSQEQVTDTLDLDNGDIYSYEYFDEYYHSPHKATIYSAVLPGLGQIYNQKYWKVPVVYTGIGTMAYFISFNSTYYNKYRSAYRDFLIRDPGNTSYEEFIPPTLTRDDVHGQYAEWFQRSLQNKRRYYKRYRDLSYIGMVAFYVLNIIDATVDAHFYDFDISDDLSFRVEPSAIPSSHDYGAILGLQMQFRF